MTAPAVMPLTMKRWRNWNSSTTGIEAISAPAANGPQLKVVAVAGEQPLKTRGDRLGRRGEILAEQDDGGDEELGLGGDERQQEDDRQHGHGQREDDPPEDLGVSRSVDLGALVERTGDRVEEALDQPGVGSERAAEVEEHDRRHRARTEGREDRHPLDHQVDRHERQ